MLSLLLLPALARQDFKPLNGVPLPPSRSEFDFVALGDNRPAGAGLPPTPVFKEILREVAWIKPAFVISSGDLVYGNEEPMSAYRTEFDRVGELIRTLRFPFFNAPGNHEIAERREFEAEYSRRFGPVYGSFDYGGCRFVALATDEAGHAGSLSSEQMTWLQSTLDGSEPAFIYMHHPIFARIGNDEAGATVQGGAALNELFKSRRVQVVFEGHDHVYNRQEHDGIPYVISGGAGAPLDAPPEEGGFFHFLIIHVRNGDAKIEVIPAGAIQVQLDGSQIHVSNYSHFDLPLNDFTFSSTRRPRMVTGTVDSKGKLRPVPVRVVEVVGAPGKFTVHVSFALTRARNTTLSPSY